MFNNNTNTQQLTERGIYPCPVCRCGQVTTMPLMEAMNCDTCLHIFAPDWEQQQLKLADSEMALTWYWTGKCWKDAYSAGFEPHWGYGLGAFLFVSLPTGLVGLSAYLFPPLPGSRGSWFPFVWMGIVFVTHLSCLVWLAIEYYQFPFFLYLRARRRR
ncbi:MAG: hypothetical protein J7647_21540 [Cyanobacteria bacterium SBLK]|nr:hypothetical protein [Cyanobacteria bacterium SBLK]